MPQINRIPRISDNIPDTLFVSVRSNLYASKTYLDYTLGKSWKLSCFILVGLFKTIDGKLLFYEGRLPLTAYEGSFKPRLHIEGENGKIITYILPRIFTGPIYFNVSRDSLLLWQPDISGECIQYLKYGEKDRYYEYKIECPEFQLFFKGHGVGLPMWLGNWNIWIIHGAYAYPRDFDLWSGFWDFIEGNGYVIFNGERIEFSGLLIYDRASHIPLYNTSKKYIKGAPCCFSDVVIYQNNVIIAIAYSKNPTPQETEKPFEHIMRINIIDENKSIITTNFTLFTDDAPPRVYKINASLPNGYLYLRGIVLSYFPPKWVKTSRLTWWDLNGHIVWGRAFIKWEGSLVIDGKEYKIDALGVSENTRFTHKMDFESGCYIDCK